MPNAAAHKIFGAASGMAASNYYVAPFLRPEERENAAPTVLFTGLVAGRIGGRIPDLLDPPIHPNHRGSYHSVLAGCVALGGATLTVKALKHLYPGGCQRHTRSRRPQSSVQSNGAASGILLRDAVIAAVILALFVGFLSHLVADSGTSRGLPFR